MKCRKNITKYYAYENGNNGLAVYARTRAHLFVCAHACVREYIFSNTHSYCGSLSNSLDSNIGQCTLYYVKIYSIQRTRTHRSVLSTSFDIDDNFCCFFFFFSFVLLFLQFTVHMGFTQFTRCEKLMHNFYRAKKSKIK